MREGYCNHITVKGLGVLVISPDIRIQNVSLADFTSEREALCFKTLVIPSSAFQDSFGFRVTI